MEGGKVVGAEERKESLRVRLFGFVHCFCALLNFFSF
jgi:hypothetical protein